MKNLGIGRAVVFVLAAALLLALSPHSRQADGQSKVPSSASPGVPARTDSPVPLLGSADFMASADRPVGWRGDGTGRYPGATPPTTWGRKRSGAGYETKGIVWMTPLPNGGISSPIVAGGRIFVTTEFADVVCLDKQSGKILWIRSNLEFEALSAEERQAMPGVAEKLDPLLQQMVAANAAVVEALNAQRGGAATSEYRPRAAVVTKQKLEKEIRDRQQTIDKKRFTGDWPQISYGFCTETPASDGQHVCAFFATGVAACYDLDGKRLWLARGPNGGEEKGHYSSPLLLGNQFIVWGEPELRGYDVETGALRWKNPARGSNCGSLFRIQVGDELVAGLQTTCFARAGDGQTIWKNGNLEYSFTTSIVEGDMIYAWTAGYKKQFKSFSIPASTEGGKVMPKLTFKKPDWAANELAGENEKGDINASPLFVDGLIYSLYPGGGITVHDAAMGEMVYRKVLPMKPHTKYWDFGGASACPTLAGNSIYIMDNQGTTVVMEPGRTYREVAVNTIQEIGEGNRQVQNLATPVFEGARMYYRTPGYLYCIGEN